MKPKKIMFVKYINAQCIVKEFNSFQEAIQYVHTITGLSSKRKLSNNCRKRIHGQIRDAMKNKEMYCGGQWIEKYEKGETNEI